MHRPKALARSREQASSRPYYLHGQIRRRGTMPVILMWGIPAIIMIGGATYLLVNLH